jgi:uncharacterized protein YjdB
MLNTGCYRTKAITVNALPSAITGSSSICVGSTTTLSNSSSGSMWSSSNTGVATIGSGNGLVTAVSVGTTTISFLTTSGCYATFELTVTAAPTVITGSTTLCSGSTITLSSTGGGTWSSNFPAAATVGSATGIVTGVAAGNATITYSLGTCYVATTVTVTAAAAAITGTTTFCSGSATTLSSTPYGGTWSSSNTGVATIGITGTGTVSVTGVAAGTSAITYTVGGGGCQSVTTVTVITGPNPITGTLAICVGSAVALSNTTPSGTWSSSVTGKATIGSATGIMTGVSAGTSLISYTVGGCRATAVVTVSAAPAAITGTTNVCVGATVTFTHGTAGGTWTSSNTGQATVGTSSGVVTGVGAGTPTITYFVSAGCYKTKPITVNGGSLAITGNTNVCQSSTSVLACTTPGGLTWTSSNPAVATIGATSGNVTGLTIGTTEITYTATSGCTSFTTVSVLVLPTAISGTLTVCQGATTALASTGTGGGTWASSNVSKATVGSSSGSVFGATAGTGGTATITYTWTNTCKRTAVVTVNPAPPAVVAISGAGSLTISGATVTLTGTSGTATGSTESWSSVTPAIATVTTSGAFTATLDGISAGTVTISYTLTNGCGSRSVGRIFTVTTPKSGLNNGTGYISIMRIYPNPTTGVITLEAPVQGKLVVFTIDGKMVAKYEVAGTTMQITLPNEMASGVYMCHFEGNDGSKTVVRLVYKE